MRTRIALTLLGLALLAASWLTPVTAQHVSYVPGRMEFIPFGNWTIFNPIDSTVYYIGSGGTVTTTEANQVRIAFPDELLPGVIRSVKFSVAVAGTLSDGADTTVVLRKNSTGATDVTLSSTVETNAAIQHYEATGINMTLVDEDYVALVVTFPNFATTNPTNVTLVGRMALEVQQ